MSRRLLFISKYPDIISEFADAMGGKEIEIDAASNGIEAAAKLKKKEYQVVVTGLSMDGYNGEQIITYLNKEQPDTVCIIYTTNISPAQLHFFINERNVFRVFLRPVNFRAEFSQALEEAFEHYDICVKNKEEESERKQELEKKKNAIMNIERKLSVNKKAQEGMRRYLERLTTSSLKEYGGKMDAGQKERLKELEMETVELCCRQDGNMAENLAEAEANARKIRELTVK